MTQIFGIHAIDGLPSKSDVSMSYDKPLTENLSDVLHPLDLRHLSSVYVASDPAGAKIFIDGIEQTGFTTPSMITDIPAGNHSFKLTSPGNVDIESSIPLEPGKTYNIFLTLGKTTYGSPYIGNSDLLLLFALGIIGYFLIKGR